MNKQFYSLVDVLPMASQAFEPHWQQMDFAAFSSAEIPRSYIDDHMAAPNVLIHPPTLPYDHSAQMHHPGEYRSTSASPASYDGMSGSDAGGYDGSNMSGSEAGSARNSPYMGVELDSYAMLQLDFNGHASTGNPYSHLQLGLTLPPGIDPALVSNSPTEQSPYGSPPWSHTLQSTPLHWHQQTSPGPVSPDLCRPPSSQRGRLSPSTHVTGYSRHAPYPTRRPSLAAGPAHPRRNMGSPSTNPMEHDDPYATANENMNYMPAAACSPSQKSIGSVRLARAAGSPESMHGMGNQGNSHKETKDTLCPECNKCFRDLRAHQLTHQLERPEKCPIAICEYSKKGFARKYDCQRHTLTHYKGTMVCGFCPGSGSSLEKSFNRADVFKRHLMAVHNVEQTPPNGRQKKGGAAGGKGKGVVAVGDVPQDGFAPEFPSGKCSTCDITFATAQQFYEHLDDCVRTHHDAS